MEIRKLRFFVQKVLPLVYDDSLSYYELLNKVVWKLNEVIETTNDYYELFGIKIADPINWSIDTQYQQYTIVMDAEGNGYISRQPVPVNVRIDDDRYWTPIFNFGAVIEGVKIGITKYDFGSNPTTDVAISEGSLLYWKEVLYRAIVDMPIGTAFVVGTNIEEADLNDLLNDVIERVGDLETGLSEEVSARETADSAEQSARESADSELQDSIDELTTNIEILDTLIKKAQIDDDYGVTLEPWSDYVQGCGSVYGIKICKNENSVNPINAFNAIKLHVPSTPKTAPEVAREMQFRAMIGGPLRNAYLKNGEYYDGTIPEAPYWFGITPSGGVRWARVDQSDVTSLEENFNGNFGILVWTPFISNNASRGEGQWWMEKIGINGKTLGEYIWRGKHPRQVLVLEGVNGSMSSIGNIHFVAFSGREGGDAGFTCPDLQAYLLNKFSENGIKCAVNMDGGGNTTLYSGVARVQPPQNYENRNTFGYLYVD